MWALVAPAIRALDYVLIGPPGGSFKSIEYLRDGTLMAGGFNGHLYLTTDYGDSWTDITPKALTRGMVVQKIAYHSHSDSLYIAARNLHHGLLLRAGYQDVIDGMQQFEVLLRDKPVRSLALSPGTSPRIFAGTDKRLHYSLDGGATWMEAATPIPYAEIRSLAIDPDNPDVIYAGSRQRAYKTTNFGTSWIPVHTGMAPDSDVFTLVFDTQNRLWAGTCGYAYQSSDRGGQWVKKPTGLKGKRIHCLEVFRDDSGTALYAGSDNGLHVFRETAEAWLQIVPDIVVHDIALDEPGNLFIATEGLGIVRYSADPPGILSMNRGLDASSPKAIAGSLRNTLWTGLVYQDTHSGLWRFHDRQWSKVTVECDGANIRDLVVTGTHLYAGTANGIFRIDLDPVTGLETGGAVRFLDGVAIKTLYLEDDGSTILAGGFDGLYVLNTLNGEFAAYPGIQGMNINCLWKCRKTGKIFAGSDTALYKKEAGTVHWIRIPLPSDKVRINRISGTEDGKQIYLATGEGVMISYNGGLRFSRFTGEGPGGSCLDLCVRNDDVYVLMGDHSIYHRKTSDFTWHIQIKLPFDAWSLSAQEDTVLAGTPANGIVLIIQDGVTP
jgi:hypothetical protein